MANPDTPGKTEGTGADAHDDATADAGAASSRKTGLRRSRHYLVIGLLAVVLLLAGLWFQTGPRAPIPPGDDGGPETTATGGTADQLIPFPTTPKATTDTAERPPAPPAITTPPALAALPETPAPVPLAPNGIAEIQRLLTDLNFTTGPANGNVSSRTVAAVRLYQRFAGLPVDGVPSAHLLDDLRKVVQAMKETPAADAR